LTLYYIYYRIIQKQKNQKTGGTIISYCKNSLKLAVALFVLLLIIQVYDYDKTKNQTNIDDLLILGTVTKNTHFSDGPVYLFDLKLKNERESSISADRIRVIFQDSDGNPVATNEHNYSIVIEPKEQDSFSFTSEKDGHAIEFGEGPARVTIELISGSGAEEEVSLRLRTTVPSLGSMVTDKEWVLRFDPVF